MATVTVRRRELDFWEKTYVKEVGRGVAITFRQLVKNLVTRSDVATREYPEVRRKYPERFRGRHRLMHRDDGSVRCVACMLCATACPANCMYIVASEHDDPRIEKYPVSFEIDLLVCIYCGYCEEACPCDAIRLDSGVHPMPSFTRDMQRIRKHQLLEDGGLSVATQGGEHKG